jgi:hypothetical protein
MIKHFKCLKRVFNRTCFTFFLKHLKFSNFSIFESKYLYNSTPMLIALFRKKMYYTIEYVGHIYCLCYVHELQNYAANSPCTSLPNTLQIPPVLLYQTHFKITLKFFTKHTSNSPCTSLINTLQIPPVLL